MTNQRILTSIILALIVWGVFLAVGATGYFVQPSLTDFRKSFIVIACMTAFLGLWAFVLRSVDNRKSRPFNESDAPALRPGWSKPGICSIAMMLLAAVLWIVAVSSYGQISRAATTALGWSAAGMVLCAASAGMIALANPRKLQGKWLGICGLIQFVAALVIFVLRMTP